ncbi:hypothetical protein D3C72_1932380 [compost metagenome]
MRATGYYVADCGTHYANVINAAMLVETLVFRRQNRLFHQLWHIADFGKRTPFLAKFTD